MKHAGILIATLLLIVSMMTACGCSSNVTTDPIATTTTAAPSTTQSTAPSTTQSTAPSTTQATEPSITDGTEGGADATNGTENNDSTPPMRRKGPMAIR